MERQWLFYDIESECSLGIPFETSNDDAIPIFLWHHKKYTPATSPYNEEIDNILEALCKFESLKNVVY